MLPRGHRPPGVSRRACQYDLNLGPERLDDQLWDVNRSEHNSTVETSVLQSIEHLDAVPNLEI